ncbi:hypothetical protein LguiB_036158 [Lonicera macranthoides]
MAALIVEAFNAKLRMLAPMSSRGKLGLSASYLCRLLSLLCILAPSTIPDNPFVVCPLLRSQLLTIHPGIIPPLTFKLKILRPHLLISSFSSFLVPLVPVLLRKASRSPKTLRVNKAPL